MTALQVVVAERSNNTYTKTRIIYMPNHCLNYITFEGENTKKILKSIFPQEAGDEVKDPLEIFVPMPSEIRNAVASGGHLGLDGARNWEKEGKPKQFVYNGKNVNIDDETNLKVINKREDFTIKELYESLLSNYKKHGHATWYTWANSNWGSKWGHYDIEILDHCEKENRLTLRAFSAWGPCTEGLITLSKNLQVCITLEYSESGMAFCGRTDIAAGTIVDSLSSDIMVGKTDTPWSEDAYHKLEDLLEFWRSDIELIPSNVVTEAYETEDEWSEEYAQYIDNLETMYASEVAYEDYLLICQGKSVPLTGPLHK